MADERAVLGESVARLRALVEDLGPERWTGPSYCDDWSIAQVLSHLGSGAELVIGSIDQALGGPELDRQAVWGEWDAKSPEVMVRDALAVDQALLDRYDAVPQEAREAFTLSFGPIQLGYDRVAGFRLNEHAVHSWDIAVVVDPSATLPASSAAIVLGAVPIMAGFAGRATGAERTLQVQTTDPDRRFTVDLTADEVTFTATGDGPADLTLPAEALIRLVYGRLDPAHTPAFGGDEADLDGLRRAFTGI